MMNTSKLLRVIVGVGYCKETQIYHSMDCHRRFKITTVYTALTNKIVLLALALYVYYEIDT